MLFQPNPMQNQEPIQDNQSSSIPSSAVASSSIPSSAVAYQQNEVLLQNPNPSLLHSPENKTSNHISTSILKTLEYPFKLISDSLLSSGTSSPRMVLSRESSASSFSLQERAEAIRKMEEELFHFNVTSKLDRHSIETLNLEKSKPKKITPALPYDIIWIILSHVAKNCKKIGNNADLVRCCLVDKRFHYFSTIFLWNHIDLKNKSALESLIETFKDTTKLQRLGKLVKSLTFSHISFIEQERWSSLLDCCPNIEYFAVERCHLQFRNDLAISDRLLPKLQALIISDCSSCPVDPLLLICQKATSLSKLSVSGCNFNELQMCDMISLCPNLKDLKLGSHAGSSLTSLGSAGGDLFAKTLAEKCPHLIGADLTGIISMTDVGWTRLMYELGPKFQKLYIRRAMQISLDSFLLVKKCTSLTRLTIANVPHLTDEIVIEILNEIGPQLTFLQLESLPVTDSTFQALAKTCTNLIQLRVFQCRAWNNLDHILLATNFTKLKTLVIHGCDLLESTFDCERVMSSTQSHGSQTPESSSMPDVRRIRDTGYISPLSGLHLMSSPLTPKSPAIPSNSNNCCTLLSTITHFEIVSCDAIEHKCVRSFLNHWVGLKRFIYVGSANLDVSIRKQLAKRKNLITSIYALTPSTPHFDM